MLPDDFALLDVSRYELKLQARESVQLPAFLGSTLRGAFGHALKAAVCVMNHRNCERCLVIENCLYPYLFETPAPSDIKLLRGQQQAPHPFILSPPFSKPPPRMVSAGADIAKDKESKYQLSDGRSIKLLRSTAKNGSDERRNLTLGDDLIFGLLLMGRAIEYMPYVVYAVSEMAKRGLGVNRGRFELTNVTLIEEGGKKRPVYSDGAQRISVPGKSFRSLRDLIQARLDELGYGIGDKNTIKLRFLTPTRIRVEGDLQAALSFELLVRNLLRRVSLLAAVHGKAPLEIDYAALIKLASVVNTDSSSLRWWDFERYSNRQRTKMKLGGFVGDVEYSGEAIVEFLPLIVAGEFLHIGASTTFGLGRYQILS